MAAASGMGATMAGRRRPERFHRHVPTRRVAAAAASESEPAEEAPESEPGVQDTAASETEPVAQKAEAVAWEYEPGVARSFGYVWAGEVGATLPLCNAEEGMSRWDPCGLSSGSNAHMFGQYRSAELKHGRVAMLAVVGLLVQHFVRLKVIMGESATGQGLESVPSGFGALSEFPSSSAFGTLVLLAGIVELRFSDEGRAPGDFGDPLNLRQQVAFNIPDDANLKTFELEHGRLAMLGVMGALAAEYTTGYDAVEQWQHAGEGAGRFFSLMQGIQ